VGVSPLMVQTIIPIGDVSVTHCADSTCQTQHKGLNIFIQPGSAERQYMTSCSKLASSTEHGVASRQRVIAIATYYSERNSAVAEVGKVTLKLVIHAPGSIVFCFADRANFVAAAEQRSPVGDFRATGYHCNIYANAAANVKLPGCTAAAAWLYTRRHCSYTY